MKGSVVLVISLVLILVSVVVPGHVLPADSSPAQAIKAISRVTGVIFFIIGLLRVRREKRSA